MALIGASDLDVFPLALGGNTFGWTSDAVGSLTVLDAFAEGGGNFLDTADGYSAWVDGNSGGESETIIGEWIRSRGNRDHVVVATKVGQHPDFPGQSGTNVRRAVDASLARLGTDWIDLYYAHDDDPTVPLEETVEAFHDLVHVGKIRWIGLSNYRGDRIREWASIAAQNGWVSPVALQPHYNLVHREPYESELASVAADLGLGVIPYFALASGFLTGKYRSRADLKGAVRGGMAEGYLNDASLNLLRALDDIAERTGASVASIALAWLLSRPGVVAPIASARTATQLPALLAAPAFQLDRADLESLNRGSALIGA
jgi:aryl-alcohol dehydrogenase-like predicted oxidoreductase